MILGLCDINTQPTQHARHTGYALTSPERGPISVAPFYSSDSQPQNGVRNKLSLIEVRGEMGSEGVVVDGRCAIMLEHVHVVLCIYVYCWHWKRFRQVERE